MMFGSNQLLPFYNKILQALFVSVEAKSWKFFHFQRKMGIWKQIKRCSQKLEASANFKKWKLESESNLASTAKEFWV